MDLNLTELGRRLRDIRNFLDKSQLEVAEALGEGQITVSRLESGKDISAKKLLMFLNYYAQYASLDLIFDPNFDSLLKEKRLVLKKLHLDSVVQERLKILKEDVNTAVLSFLESFNKNIGEILNLTEQKNSKSPTE